MLISDKKILTIPISNINKTADKIEFSVDAIINTKLKINNEICLLHKNNTKISVLTNSIYSTFEKRYLHNIRYS